MKIIVKFNALHENINDSELVGKIKLVSMPNPLKFLQYKRHSKLGFDTYRKTLC